MTLVLAQLAVFRKADGRIARSSQSRSRMNEATSANVGQMSDMMVLFDTCNQTTCGLSDIYGTTIHHDGKPVQLAR